MRSFRIVPRGSIAIALALMIGLASPAQSQAAHPVNHQIATRSVLKSKTDDPKRSSEGVFSPAEIQQTADYLIDQVMPTLQGLVFTMMLSKWTVQNMENGPPPPVPETVVPLIVQPPPTPSDVPPGLTGDPTPQSTVSPEPGTLIGGLVGAGAFLYRYYRRRRTKGAAEPEDSEMELAIE